MEPAGVERHRRSPKGELDGRRGNQSSRNLEENPVVQQNQGWLKGGGGNRTRE